MDLLRLINPIVVSGRDFFGRTAEIRFSPSDLPGWHWKCGSEIVPITSDIASYSPRRITLRYKNHLLETYEHIGALRWTGLDGIVLESSKLPPYHGRTKELWHALKPSCRNTREKVPWIKPSNICAETMPDSDSRSVSLAPFDRKLIVLVIVKIKGIGTRIRSCELPSSLENVFGAYTLGWPSQLYHFSKLAGLFGWPHHENIEWAQANTRESLLDKISLHRTDDLLGALSLITHDHLVSGKVISYKGGHRLDMGMVKKLSYAKFRQD